LNLRPGDVIVRVNGDADFERGVLIPSSEAAVQIKRGSMTVKVVGAVFFGIGGIGAIYLLATDKDTNTLTAESTSREEARDRFYIAIGAAIFTVTGVIMMLASGNNGAEVKPNSSYSASSGGFRFRGLDANAGGTNGVEVRGKWTF
jgi:hypothetical protein